MNNEQTEFQPNEYYEQMSKAFQELLDITSIVNYEANITPYKAPTLRAILKKVEEIDDNEIPDKKPSDNLEHKKEQLLELSNNPDLITTNFYTQSVIKAMQNKKVKNEAINCAYIHAIQGFPSLKTEQEKLKKCQLQSYQLGQEQESRFIKSPQSNVYQLHKIKQISNNVKDKFVMHFTIYHPFTFKKTQIIVASNDATVEQLIKEIDCPVEQTEKMFYKEEVKNFDPPQFNFGKSHEILGQLKIALCKQYLYTHLNQCKHRVYVNEIRSLTLGESGLATIFKAPLKIRNCEGCSRSAQLFRIDDKLIPDTSPAFLCQFCNQNLHGNEKGIQYFCD